MITWNPGRVEPAFTCSRVMAAYDGVGPVPRAAWPAAAAASFVVARLSAHGLAAQWMLGVVGCLLATAALVDVHEQRLPNTLLACAAIAALLAAGFGDRGLVAVLGMALAGGSMLVVRVVRGVGMGDVKMAAVVGAAVASGGPAAAPVAVAVAAFLAAVYGLVAQRRRLPLGPALWCGWAVALLLPLGRWWA